VLYAAGNDDSREKWFHLSAPGTNSVHEDGANTWRKDSAGTHYFLSLRENGEDLVKEIDSLMLGSR
jgi:hypothetical protein